MEEHRAVDHEPSAALFRVLFIGTRDVCRGPAGERLLRAWLEAGHAGDAFIVSSAGTRPVAGEPMHPQASAALSALSVDVAGHGSRRMTERRLAQADLVLTATRMHRAAIHDQFPGAEHRTFTVREFARLLGQVRDPLAREGTSSPLAIPPADAGPHALVTAAAVLRREPAVRRSVDRGNGGSGHTAGGSADGSGDSGPEDHGDDIDDPTGGSHAEYEQVVAMLNEATREIARALIACLARA